MMWCDMWCNMIVWHVMWYDVRYCIGMVWNGMVCYAIVWYGNVQKYLSLQSHLESAFIVLAVNSNSPQQLIVRSITISMSFFWPLSIGPLIDSVQRQFWFVYIVSNWTVIVSILTILYIELHSIKLSCSIIA